MYSGSNVLIKTLESSEDGVYDFGYYANGTYPLYINDKFIQYITVNAMPTTTAVSAPGDEISGGLQKFRYITDLTFGPTLTYTATAPSGVSSEYSGSPTLTYGQTAGNVISAAASAPEGHTLTYQWYEKAAEEGEADTPIDGATQAEFTIPSDGSVGTHSYYCVVASKDNFSGATAATTSDPVTVTVAPGTPTLSDLHAENALTYGQTLADAGSVSGTATGAHGETITGTWEFEDTTIMPAVSDSDQTPYNVKFTPDADNINYGPASGTATVTVNKANISPSVTISKLDVWRYAP